MGMEGKKWYTREMMESVVQGSEGELGVGLKERNVVDYEGLYHFHAVVLVWS